MHGLDASRVGKANERSQAGLAMASVLPGGGRAAAFVLEVVAEAVEKPTFELFTADGGVELLLRANEVAASGPEHARARGHGLPGAGKVAQSVSPSVERDTLRDEPTNLRRTLARKATLAWQSNMKHLQIKQAETPEEIDHVRALFAEYQASLDVDLGFQGFPQELSGLPGSYAPPSGRLLLATVEESPCAVVALQAIDAETCEMKRLYVRPNSRGTRLGRLLVEQVLLEARQIGYRRICLDTLPSMTEAAAMYERFGFRDIPPYRYNPVAGTRYMALSIG